jgi:hypothetical protein
MTPPVRRTDDGAALVIALIFITVVAVIMAAVLAFADTNLRTTIALRGEAAAGANADGAAQVAINTLRRGSYAGTGNCFSSAELQLSNVYQPPTGPADSAAVTCAPDTVENDPNVTVSALNRPANAILTVSQGLEVDVNGHGSLKVDGGVFSNSTIGVEHGTLAVDGPVIARGSCSGASPGWTCGIGGAPSPTGNDPNYPAPTAATTLRSVPTCGNNQVVTFLPGRYRDVDALNSRTRTSGCKNSIFHFTPGTYYFDFDKNKAWEIDTGSLLGGTPRVPLVAGTQPTMPGACKAPTPPTPRGGWTKQGPGDGGVQFVFGGTSRILVSHAQFEICGTYSTSAPPIAVYGLKQAVGSVPAQNGCVLTGLTCPVIQADNSPDRGVYIQGTTYVPLAALDLSLNNPGGQGFSVGVIARRLVVEWTGNSNPPSPVFAVPDDATSYGQRMVVRLTVFVCPGVSTCSSTTGRERLQVKVGLVDPTGTPVAGARQVTVYSWGVQR